MHIQCLLPRVTERVNQGLVPTQKLSDFSNIMVCFTLWCALVTALSDLDLWLLLRSVTRASRPRAAKRATAFRSRHCKCAPSTFDISIVAACELMWTLFVACRRERTRSASSRFAATPSRSQCGPLCTGYSLAAFALGCLTTRCLVLQVVPAPSSTGSAQPQLPSSTGHSDLPADASSSSGSGGPASEPSSSSGSGHLDPVATSSSTGAAAAGDESSSSSSTAGSFGQQTS